MEENGWTGRTVTLKYKLDTYQGIWKVLLLLCMLIIDPPQSLPELNHVISGSKPTKSFTRCVIITCVLFYQLTVCKIGKELLLAETPLTLRLIGLRVTKLKDLRAQATHNGIKRVCDAVNALALHD